MQHLEKQFQPELIWKNHGVYGWHINHKNPVAAYSSTSYTDVQFKQCWNLNNFQPLWAKDNLLKGDKIIL